MTEIIKSLKPVTIIPDRLYVERAADRQLNQIVEDMGRPGYVLVARQMGKTNLLLRMKRRREELGDLVYYFDLSSRFDSVRELYRAVIDTIVDANTIFRPLETQIANDRAGALEPNVEFDRHIRLILRSAPAKRVIVVLDEIDSLVGTSYSDKVLSHIRSMYFARANHSEYERLTYVLSGVAEPSDLIKDKNISPFNIGEKIYLNDFEHSELALLLAKAELNFPVGVVDEIFEYTAGNPRMSWDICSALEDLLLDGKSLNKEDVLDVVERLYLSRFDRAPVDHIRTLAQSDSQIRDAVMSIHYGKADSLSDDVRSRLYLAGIASLAPGNPPSLKNKIIEAALSEEWLAQVASGRRGLLDAASRRFSEKNYREAVDLFGSYLAQFETAPELSVLHLAQRGIAKYHLGKYGEAVDDLRAALELPSENVLKDTIKYHLGSALLRAGDPDKSIKLFEELVESDSPQKLSAKHAIGSAYIAISPRDNAEKIIKLNEEVLNSLDEASLDRTTIIELRASSYFNIVQTNIALGNLERARDVLNRALENCPAGLAPTLHLKAIEIAGDREERLIHLAKATKIIADAGGKLPDTTISVLGYQNAILALLVSRAIEFKDADSLSKLIDEARREADAKNDFSALLDLAKRLDEYPIFAARILEFAFLRTDIARLADFEDRIAASRLWAMVVTSEKKHIAVRRFIAEVSTQVDSFDLGEEDLMMVVGQLSMELRNARTSFAQTLIDFVHQFGDKPRHTSFIIYLLFLYFEMLVYRRSNLKVQAVSVAQKLLGLMDTEEGLSTSEIGADASALLPQFKEAARDTLKKMNVETRSAGDLASFKGRDPFGKIRRNEVVKVRDATSQITFLAKFKKVEQGLRSGKLELVLSDE